MDEDEWEFQNPIRFRMVPTQEVNVGAKIEQTTSIYITLHKYLHSSKAKENELYLFCLVV